MAKIIDTRGGDDPTLVVLGSGIAIPNGAATVTPLPGTILRDPNTGIIGVYTGPQGGPFKWYVLLDPSTATVATVF